MLDEGYASDTFDRVAATAGVARGLVYYYFSTLDELFVAVLRDSTGRAIADLSAATMTGTPLRAAWTYACNRTGTALLMEFLAPANHRSAVRAAIGECSEQIRRSLMQALMLSRSRRRGARGGPASAALFMLSCIPRPVAMEEMLGIEMCHADIVAVAERFLELAEPVAC